MKRKPWSLIVLAVLHWLSPFGNKLFNAFWAPMPAAMYLRISFQWENILRNWPEFVFPLIAGTAIYLCRRWSFYIYFVAMLSLFVSSYIGYQGRLIASPSQLALVYLINIALVAYFLIPKVRVVYLDPRLRWWEADKRYRADFSADVIAPAGRFSGLIGNISKSGLFMKSESVPEDQETVSVEFIYDNKTYQFPGTAIIHANQKQVGFGVRFLHTSVTSKSIKGLIESLDADGRLIESRLPTNEDGFGHWIKTLVKTGKGLTPEKIDRKP